MKQITASQIGKFIELTAGNVSRAQFQARLQEPASLLSFLKIGNASVILPSITTADFSSLITDWEKYYYERFDKRYRFSNLPVPNGPSKYSWLVCNHQGVSVEEALSGGKAPQPYWKWTNEPLDDVLDWSFGRDALKKPYIVRFRPNSEADADLKNTSADMVIAQKLNTITLKERLLLGDFLYWKQGIILDKNVITYCTGSRYSDGHVPFVHWIDDKVNVDRYSSGHRPDNLRPRQAVS